jgi:hypothetical protein
MAGDSDYLHDNAGLPFSFTRISAVEIAPYSFPSA